MAKWIIGLLVVFLTLWNAYEPADAATRGKRYMYGMRNPQELAQKIEAALAIDPTGKSLIDMKKCFTPGDGSCASAYDFLKSIRDIDPNATVNGVRLTSVAQLPAFISKLKMEDPLPGTYPMFCMYLDPRTGDYARLANCVQRTFHPGEMAYVDPDTGLVVLAGDCNNPVGKPIPPVVTCADLIVPVKKDDVVLMRQYGPASILEDRCTGLLRPGEQEYESPAVERCDHPNCDLDQTEKYAEGDRQWDGSFQAEEDGYAIIRVPVSITLEHSGYQIFICVDREGSEFQALGVRWLDYLPRRSALVLPPDRDIAVIWPDKAAAVAAGRPTRIPGMQSILWLDDNPSHAQDPVP